MSEIRDMIADSINRMFSETIDKKLRMEAEAGQWPSTLWDLVEEGGFPKLLVPESAGGTGGVWLDAYPVLHAIGYHQAPLPLVETIVGNGFLGYVGLPVPDGPVTIIQQGAGDELILAMRDSQLALDGSAKSIPWARQATHLVIGGRVEGKCVIGLIENGHRSIRITAGANIAQEPRDKVDLDDCRCIAHGYLDERFPINPVSMFGALARSITMVGAADFALHQSVQYANDRIQFGHPIGKFQAIQHALAVLAGEVTAAGTAAQAACDSANRGNARFEIAVAKIRSGTAAGIAARIAHQVNGAIGFTYEHNLHYATKRLWCWRAEFGSESVWAQELGENAIKRGGQNLWADLTALAGQ